MYSGYYNVMTNYVWKEGEDPETNYRSCCYFIVNLEIILIKCINDESLCVLSILYFTAK